MKNDVWDVVPRPKDKFVVTSKWLYKIKQGACCGSFAFTSEIFLKTPKKTYMLENVIFLYNKK